MKQFLGIVLRNQFNLFYRFGYTFIPKSQLVEFDGNINNETRESIIKQFKTVTPFEYDEEYLILHLEKKILMKVILFNLKFKILLLYIRFLNKPKHLLNQELTKEYDLKLQFLKTYCN